RCPRPLRPPLFPYTTLFRSPARFRTLRRRSGADTVDAPQDLASGVGTPRHHAVPGGRCRVHPAPVAIVEETAFLSGSSDLVDHCRILGLAGVLFHLWHRFAERV